MCGRIFNDYPVANLLLNLSVKEFRKSGLCLLIAVKIKKLGSLF